MNDDDLEHRLPVILMRYTTVPQLQTSVSFSRPERKITSFPTNFLWALTAASLSPRRTTHSQSREVVLKNRPETAQYQESNGRRKDGLKGLMNTSYQLAIQKYHLAVMAGKSAEVCHCCGARIREGLKGCCEMFLDLCSLGYSHPEYRQAVFYGVDAHALQHPEIHGKKSSAGHLLRLHWIFERGQQARSGRVPEWWQHYLECEEIPLLEPPGVGARGDVTIADVTKADSPREYAAHVQYWAWSAYEAWRVHHDWAGETLSRVLSVHLA